MDGVYLPLLLTAMLSTLPNSVLCMQLPAPVNLSMDSLHFVHLLSWEAGTGSSKGVSYIVDVCKLSKGRKECETAPCSPVPDHSPLRCNLTEVFTSPDKTYYTIVSASSGNQTSPPANLSFQPIKDTIPEPPLLTVIPCSQSLCVHLQAPSERLLTVYNCTVYPCFKYKLNISVNEEFKFSKEVEGLETVVLEHLVPGQRYCVSVGIQKRIFSNGTSVCAYTATAESSVGAQVFTALGVTVLLFLGGIVLYSWIFCVKTQLPFVLSSLQSSYEKHLMGCMTVESLHTISLEPNTVKDIKGDEGGEGDRGENPEDARVVYERLGNQSESCSGASEPGSSSTPPDVQSENGYYRTHSLVSRIPTAPVQVIKSLSPGEYALNPQHRTGIWLQQNPVNPPAGGQTFTSGLFPKQLRPSFIEHRCRDKAEEGKINVNLFSLTLGGRTELEHLKQEVTGNMEIPEQVIYTSLQRDQENNTDIKPTCSLTSEWNIRDFEGKEVEEEKEGDEEDEENSGYMMRN